MKPFENAWRGIAQHLPESWADSQREAKILFFTGANAARQLAIEAQRLMTDDQYAQFDADVEEEISEYLSAEFLGTFDEEELGKPQ